MHAPRLQPEPPPRKRFLNELFDKEILFDTGVEGLYGRSGAFEDVVEAFDRLVTRYGEQDAATSIHFPPGIARPLFEKSGYMKSFPQLAGTVHSFMGGDADHCALLAELEAGADWTGSQKATDIVLTPRRLLSALSHRRTARSLAAGRPALRPAILLLPPRTFEGSGPHADVPHARICAHRHA